MYWIQDVPVKQAGTCPVCRREAVKFRSSQTTCGSKACRDKKYKLLKAGIDPCRESSPTAAAPKPRPRLGSREFSDFAEVQRRTGNAVAGRIGPNVLLADGKLCAVEAIRAALATGYGYEAEAKSTPAPSPDIDAEVVVRLLRQGEPVCKRCGQSHDPDDECILTVFGCYQIDMSPGRHTGRLIAPEALDLTLPGDYGADPLGDGTFRMVPSGDVVDYAERCRRLDSRK